MNYPSLLNSRNSWVEYFEARMPSEPHLHQIEPTNHCPYSCIMCPRPEKMKRNKGVMDMKLYQSVIDQVAGYSEQVRSKEIELFHFGEALLHPGISEMVGYASQKYLDVTLSVNPPHLTPEVAETVLNSNPYKLILSLDGYDEESYQRIRGRAASFSRAVSNINFLSGLIKKNRYQTQVCLRIIRLNANNDHIERFVQEWDDKGIQIEVRPFFPWAEKDMAGVGEYQKYPPFMPCPFPWQHTVVQWDGTVVPCCRDYNAVNKMGNVKDAPLKEIWNNDRYHELREQHRTGNYRNNAFCRDCMDIYYTENTHDDMNQDRGCRSKIICEPLSKPEVQHVSLSSYVLVNPSWKLDLSKGIAVSADINAGKPIRLNIEERVLLYWALRLKTVTEIAGLMHRETDKDFLKIISGLHARGIISVSDISFKDAQKQNILSANELVLKDSEMSLLALWAAAVQKFEKNSFLIWAGDGSIFTYGDADFIILKTASFLVGSGLGQGDRILVFALSSPEFVFVFWAAMLMGIVVIPVNITTGKNTLLEIIRETEPKIIFADSGERAKDLSGVNCKIVIFDSTETSDAPFPMFSACIESASGTVSFPEISGRDDAMIIFTSGTTGPNKGVVLSHGGLYRSSQSMSELYYFSGEDKLLSTADFNVISGTRNVCIVPLHTGASAILPLQSDKGLPLKMLDICDAYRVTILNTVPAFMTYCISAHEKICRAFNLRSLKKILCTGTMLHQSVLKKFVSMFNIRVFNYYGLTETTGACTFITEDIVEMDNVGIGRPWKIVAAIQNDKGELLEENCIGELLIYTDNMMKGYFNRPEQTKERIKNGWLHTGDMAYRDKDNNIVLVGRTSDLIIDRNGDNIYPGEIEDVILNVDGVEEAGVTGYPDNFLNERIAAFLVLSENTRRSHQEIFHEISETIKRNLSPHKVPSKYVSVDKLPRGVNGKLLRKTLATMIEGNI